LQWSKKAGTPAKLRPAEVDLSELLAGWNGDECSWAAARTAEDPITTIITIKRLAEITLAKLCVRKCCTILSYFAIYYRPAPQGTGNDLKNLPGTAQFLSRQTDRRTPCLRPPFIVVILLFHLGTSISRPGHVRPSRSWNQDRHLDGRTDGQTDIHHLSFNI
jgi:hypothetical protein